MSTKAMAHDQAQNHPPSPEAMQRGYEPSAIRVRGLLIFVICFAATGALLHAAVWFYQEILLKHERAEDVARSAVPDQQPPPPPRLQPSMAHDSLPFQDLQDMRENEDFVFSRLGWPADSKTHAVLIPDSIVQRVAQMQASRQSGPATAPTATPRDANTILPGPPTTQNIHETGGSPQGPAPNEREDLNDRPTNAGSPARSLKGPRPERPQP